MTTIPLIDLSASSAATARGDLSTEINSIISAAASIDTSSSAPAYSWADWSPAVWSNTMNLSYSGGNFVIYWGNGATPTDDQVSAVTAALASFDLATWLISETLNLYNNVIYNNALQLYLGETTPFGALRLQQTSPRIEVAFFNVISALAANSTPATGDISAVAAVSSQVQTLLAGLAIGISS